MKVLFVANTDKHINLCYRPYMKYLKENNMQNLNAENGTREFFTSDDFELFKENAKQLGFEIE